MGKLNSVTTYEKKKNASDAVNNLFVTNISKRKSSKRKKRNFKKIIKESMLKLPPKDEHHHLMEDSFKSNFSGDLFDYVKKIENYNVVNKPVTEYIYSESDSSLKHKTDDSLPAISIINPSPVKRKINPRKYKRKEKIVKHCSISQDTLDTSISNELCIEKEPIFKVPLTDKDTLNFNSNSSDNLIKSVTFDKPLCEKNQVVSTPDVFTCKEILNHTILSPYFANSEFQKNENNSIVKIPHVTNNFYIKNHFTSTPYEPLHKDYGEGDGVSSVLNTSKNLESRSVELSSIENLVEKSIKEIKKWDVVTPDFTTTFLTPKLNFNKRRAGRFFLRNMSNVNYSTSRRKSLDLNSFHTPKSIGKSRRYTTNNYLNTASNCDNNIKINSDKKRKNVNKCEQDCFVNLDYCIELEKKLDWKLNCKPVVLLNKIIDILGINNSINCKVIEYSLNDPSSKGKKSSDKSRNNLSCNEEQTQFLRKCSKMINSDKNKLQKKFKKSSVNNYCSPVTDKNNIKQPIIVLLRNEELESLFQNSTEKYQKKDISAEICAINKEIKNTVSNIINISQNKRYITIKSSSITDKNNIKQPIILLSRNEELESLLQNSEEKYRKKDIAAEICAMNKEIKNIVSNIMNLSQNECYITIKRGKMRTGNELDKPREITNQTDLLTTKNIESSRTSNKISKENNFILNDIRETIDLKPENLHNRSDSVMVISSDDSEILSTKNCSKKSEISPDIEKLLQSPLTDFAKTEYLKNRRRYSSDLFDSPTNSHTCVPAQFVKETADEVPEKNFTSVEIDKSILAIKNNTSELYLNSISRTEYVRTKKRNKLNNSVDCSTQTDIMAFSDVNQSRLHISDRELQNYNGEMTCKNNDISNKQDSKITINSAIKSTDQSDANIENYHNFQGFSTVQSVFNEDVNIKNCHNFKGFQNTENLSETQLNFCEKSINSYKSIISSRVLNKKQNNIESISPNLFGSETSNSVINLEEIETPKATRLFKRTKVLHGHIESYNSSRINKKLESPPLTTTNLNNSTQSLNERERDSFIAPLPCNKITLKGGKLYKRSLLLLRRNSWQVEEKSFFSQSDKNDRRSSRISLSQTINRPSSFQDILLESFAVCSASFKPEHPGNKTLEEKFGRISVNESRENENEDAILNTQPLLPLTSVPLLSPKDQAKVVIFEKCRQTEPLPFSECYPDSILKNCFKIGEGVYGEVFQFRGENGKPVVMKIIPIEGNQMVNGEVQKTFEEIITEIVIASELSCLRDNDSNKTKSYSELLKVRCLRGRWPDKLLDLWNLYDEDRQSQNDSPEMFGEQQLYITLELANGGRDMEAFIFNNALQAFSIFKQVACALAVAEEALQFEHRDLHWGNVLVSVVDRDEKVEYTLDNCKITMKTYGVVATIIDFTLSRLTKNNCCIFTDLSRDDELFAGTDDYQFEIYRLMKKRNGNEWEHFEPYTNILWLHYMLDKSLGGLRYRNTKSKVHTEYINKLAHLKEIILQYTSVKDFVLNHFKF